MARTTKSKSRRKLGGIAQPSVQQQLLFSIVQSTDDAIISRSLDGRILTWNSGAERLYGYTMAEIVGKPITILAPKNMPHDHADITNKLLHGQRIEHYVTRRRRKDGHERIVDLTVSPLKAEDGDIIGVVSVGRDVTEQHELIERQREFVSIASHELRTPLTALTGYLSLAENAEGVQSEEYVGRALKASRRLSQLVEDMLEVARIEDDRVQLHMKPTDPDALVREIIEELQPSLEDKNQTLRVRSELRSRDKIQVDPTKLQQIIRNVLDNAIKYTPLRGRISISLGPVGRNIRLRIRDTGIGIDQGNLERIYDRFFREYTELSVTAGGTGLGLFITRQLVDRMGGTLQIRSRRKAGTMVTIEFPRTLGSKRTVVKRQLATMRKKK